MQIYFHLINYTGKACFFLFVFLRFIFLGALTSRPTIIHLMHKGIFSALFFLDGYTLPKSRNTNKYIFFALHRNNKLLNVRNIRKIKYHGLYIKSKRKCP